MPPAADRRVFALLGPTASGKSRLALELAGRKRGLEVVSVDSAQVYRGMDIGTAKPTPAERAALPHHVIDIADPSERYSAGRFRADAARAIEDILSRDRVPLLVGGTMLYYRALAEGLDEMPAADPQVRARISAEAAEKGWPALHAGLAKADPQAAARIMPNDAQRIQRALEVWRMTGKPISALRIGKPRNAGFEIRPFVILPADRAELHKRIAERFDRMLQDGLIEELRSLRRKYALEADLPSMRAVGYRQAWDFLEGKISKEDVRDAAVAATRQLAKRQISWLRTLKASEPAERLAGALTRD